MLQIGVRNANKRFIEIQCQNQKGEVVQQLEIMKISTGPDPQNQEFWSQIIVRKF